MNMLETLQNLLNDSGFVSFFADGGWKNLVMIAVSCLLLYLGIKKQFEPLLLVGIQLLRRRCKLVQRPVPP